jgi:hypothetical protein
VARDSSIARRFVVESTRSTDLAADLVMRRILDPATWPSWQPEILSTEGPPRLAAGDVVTGRAQMLGFRVQGTSTTVEAGPREFVEDVVVGVRMHVVYRVEERDGGCYVTRRLEAQMPTGIAGRILARLLAARLRRMQKRVLDALTDQADVSD